MNLKLFLLGVLVSGAFSSQTCFAQQSEKKSDWYFGVGGGIRSSHVAYSNLDKEYFPKNKNLGSGLFSVFVQGEFGSKRQFGIRPQLSFLNRGGHLTQIGNIDDSYKENDIDDVEYSLKAHYIDIRVPLIYNFGKAESCLRPYVFVAPVLGFATGGHIELKSSYTDNTYKGYEIGVNKGNLNSTYFAGQIGVGVKWAIPVVDTKLYLGLEALYEYGFTDTYADKEKNSQSKDVAALFSHNYKIDGNRKFSGFELQATISVPFDIFKKREVRPVVEQPQIVPQIVKEPVEEKPCYTLEEINDMMAHNQSIEGKTICAVDVINFDFAKSVIKPESYSYLDQLAETLKRSNRRIEVKGHTDNIGNEETNMNLSRERAEAVVEYLVKKGVSRNKLIYSYYGMSCPLTTNDTEEGRAKNRRVEFTILNNF